MPNYVIYLISLLPFVFAIPSSAAVLYGITDLGTLGRPMSQRWDSTTMGTSSVFLRPPAA
jgi:hypothetical protein